MRRLLLGRAGLVGGERRVERMGGCAQALALELDQLALAPQCGPAVIVRVIEQALHLGERESELTPDDDLLEALKVGVAIQPVARLAALARSQQADLVVVVQGADGDSGQLRDFTDGSHARHRNASRGVRVKAEFRG